MQTFKIVVVKEGQDPKTGRVWTDPGRDFENMPEKEARDFADMMNCTDEMPGYRFYAIPEA